MKIKYILSILQILIFLVSCRNSDINTRNNESLDASDSTKIVDLQSEATEVITYHYENKLYFNLRHRDYIYLFDDGTCIINGRTRTYKVDSALFTSNDKSSPSHSALAVMQFNNGEKLMESRGYHEDKILNSTYKVHENYKNPYFVLSSGNQIYCSRTMNENDVRDLTFIKEDYLKRIYEVTENMKWSVTNNISLAESRLNNIQIEDATPEGEGTNSDLIAEYRSNKSIFDKNLVELNDLYKSISETSSYDFFKPRELFNISKKLRAVQISNSLFIEYVDAVSNNMPLNTAVLLEKKRLFIQEEL